MFFTIYNYNQIDENYKENLKIFYDIFINNENNSYKEKEISFKTFEEIADPLNFDKYTNMITEDENSYSNLIQCIYFYASFIEFINNFHTKKSPFHKTTHRILEDRIFQSQYRLYNKFYGLNYNIGNFPKDELMILYEKVRDTLTFIDKNNLKVGSSIKNFKKDIEILEDISKNFFKILENEEINMKEFENFEEKLSCIKLENKDLKKDLTNSIKGNIGYLAISQIILYKKIKNLRKIDNIDKKLEKMQNFYMIIVGAFTTIIALFMGELNLIKNSNFIITDLTLFIFAGSIIFTMFLFIIAILFTSKTSKDD